MGVLPPLSKTLLKALGRKGAEEALADAAAHAEHGTETGAAASHEGPCPVETRLHLSFFLRGAVLVGNPF